MLDFILVMKLLLQLTLRLVIFEFYYEYTAYHKEKTVYQALRRCNQHKVSAFATEVARIDRRISLVSDVINFYSALKNKREYPDNLKRNQPCSWIFEEPTRITTVNVTQNQLRGRAH
jgi:hypothetical protein